MAAKSTRKSIFAINTVMVGFFPGQSHAVARCELLDFDNRRMEYIQALQISVRDIRYPRRVQKS